MSLSGAGPSGRPESKRATPSSDATRPALPWRPKAAKGDVYAARELREHSDWYYGSAQGDAWKELLTEAELQTIQAILQAARHRALSTPPGVAELPPRS
jgi:hypothetical protein